MKRILLLSVLLLFSIILNAQGWGQTQKIVASDRDIGDYFGQAVSVSGDYAIIGAYFDDITSSIEGSVYIYKNDGTGHWIEHQKIVAPDKRQFDQFGYSVDIDGNYLIVGALGQDYDESNSNFISSAGAAYIYEKETSGDWIFVKKLIASDRETTRQLGRCVSISGNYAIVGLDREDFDVSGENEIQNAGAAYIYERNNSGEWSEVQKIVASERSTFDYFGYNGLSIDGNYAVIGAMQEDEDENGANTILSAGSAYIFERATNGTWSEMQKIVASDREQGAYFGWSIALDGDHLVVSSNQDNEFRGAVYVFEKDGNDIWQETQKLTGSNTLTGDRFGQDVDIEENRIVVGAHLKDIGSPGDDGAAYIYEKESGAWAETAFIYDMFNQTSEYFGYSVAISEDYAIAGSYQDGEDENEENNLGASGAAFIFDANETNTLSVVQSESEMSIKAYPNPVQNILNLDLGNFYETVQITMFNTLGQRVYSENYMDSKTIELEFNQPKGLYIVEVIIDGQNKSVLKVIKH